MKLAFRLSFVPVPLISWPSCFLWSSAWPPSRTLAIFSQPNSRSHYKILNLNSSLLQIMPKIRKFLKPDQNQRFQQVSLHLRCDLESLWMKVDLLSHLLQVWRRILCFLSRGLLAIEAQQPQVLGQILELASRNFGERQLWCLVRAYLSSMLLVLCVALRIRLTSRQFWQFLFQRARSSLLSC